MKREQLQEEIPSLDMALKFTERPGTNLRNIKLERRRMAGGILYQPQETRSARSPAPRNWATWKIRRVVYSLLQAGLIEVVRPEGAFCGRHRPPGISDRQQRRTKKFIGHSLDQTGSASL